jgi:ATP-dependent Clp protease ATP-binding subunit ClpC
MTSNIGTDIINEFSLKRNEIAETEDTTLAKYDEQAAENNAANYEAMQVLMQNELKKYFRAEFLNRVDEIVIFQQLKPSQIEQIAKIHIDKLAKQIAKQGYNLSVTDAALHRIAELGYDAQYGARPLRRAIQHYITDELAKLIIANQIPTGDVNVDVDGSGHFLFK